MPPPVDVNSALDEDVSDLRGKRTSTGSHCVRAEGVKIVLAYLFTCDGPDRVRVVHILDVFTQPAAGDFIFYFGGVFGGFSGFSCPFGYGFSFAGVSPPTLVCELGGLGQECPTATFCAAQTQLGLPGVVGGSNLCGLADVLGSGEWGGVMNSSMLAAFTSLRL